MLICIRRTTLFIQIIAFLAITLFLSGTLSPGVAQSEASYDSKNADQDDRREATDSERLALLRAFLVTRDPNNLPDMTKVRVFLADGLVVRGLDRSINDLTFAGDPGPIPYYCPSFSSSCFCNGIIDCIDLQLSGKCSNGGVLEEHGGGWDKCPQAPGASDDCDTWGKCP